MSIKICGKTQINVDFNPRLRPIRSFASNGASRLFIFILVATCYLLLVTGQECLAGEVFYAAGRGTKDNGTIWKYERGKWSVHSIIPDCSEIFTLAIDKQGNLWVGGGHFGYGVVWQYTDNGWDKGMRLPESRGVYALVVDKKGNIWAGGTGTKNIWRYDGTKWDNGTELSGCVGVYCLAIDSQENIWAGGEGKIHVWRYNGKEWSSGTKLSDCTDVFTLCVDTLGGTIWAGGRGGKSLWRYSAKGSATSPASLSEAGQAGGRDKQWFPGIILTDSTEISAFTINPQGQLYAAGAGRSKVWIKQEGLNWLSTNLDDCIAIYTISSGKKLIMAGGWNSQRKGRIWLKVKDTWKGIDLDDCYVIRALAVMNE